MPNGGIATTWLFPQYSFFIQAFLHMPKKTQYNQSAKRFLFINANPSVSVSSYPSISESALTTLNRDDANSQG